jgi:hypothetical protein
LTCALDNPKPTSSAACFGSCAAYPGKIVFVGADAGRILITDNPVPASPMAWPSGCGPFGCDAGGSFGFFGAGIGVVAGG